MYLDKDILKQKLDIDTIFNLLQELGGEPILRGNDTLISKTICHNPAGEGSHKLYYYDNTQLFRCYTSCSCSFDIFDLITKVKKLEGFENWELYNSMCFIASYLGISGDMKQENFNEQSKLQDWEIFNKYNNKKFKKDNKKRIEFLNLDYNLIQNFPQPRLLDWEEEGIKQEVIKARNIKYNPSSEGIIIPHYDIDGNLIGIRERTLVQEQAERYGKYHPAYINGKMYNHPLSFNLYNLNFSKDNIKTMRKALVFEGEKSCLKYASYLGLENDITVATCGFNLLSGQVDLLRQVGVEEIIIGFDKQFKEFNDAEHLKLVKKFYDIHDKFGGFFKISYLFDKEGLLNYKDSPVDQGIDVFFRLYENRVVL